MMQLLQSRYTLNHMGRLKLCTFLHGNGIGDSKIRKILAPLIKPGRDKDVDGILVLLNSSTYDSMWHYFSVAKQIRLYLNGNVAEKLNDYTPLKDCRLRVRPLPGARRLPVQAERLHREVLRRLRGQVRLVSGRQSAPEHSGLRAPHFGPEARDDALHIALAVIFNHALKAHLEYLGH
jgi:hypothetical protein